MTPNPDSGAVLRERVLNYQAAYAEDAADPKRTEGERAYASAMASLLADTAAALSAQGEARIVAHRWRRNGELVASDWIDGDVTTRESEAAEACKEVAAWAVEYAYTAPTPPATAGKE